MSTNDYQNSAADYALREITGTDALAFRTIAERISSLQLTGNALDLGCGAGRSTRFLQSFSLDVTGVDVSDVMVTEAKQRDSVGSYVLYDFRKTDAGLPFDSSSFNLLLATWVVLEIASRQDLDRLLGEAARVLRPGGVAFIAANTAEFYCHRWVSCEVDFPENQSPLRSGQRVKARLMPEGVVVTDTFWSDEEYCDIFKGAKLEVAHAWRPMAASSETGWIDETRVAPWVVYELVKDE